MRGKKYIKYFKLENCNEESVKEIGHEFEHNVNIAINVVVYKMCGGLCKMCGGLMWLRREKQRKCLL